MTRKARVTIGPTAGDGIVEIDGQNISHAVRTIHIDASVYGPPRLQVELITDQTVVDGEVTIELLAPTHEALVALGWTPPDCDPPATEPRIDVKLFGSWQPVGPAMVEAMEDFQPDHPLLATLREHQDHHTAAYYTAFGYRKAHCYTCSSDIWKVEG